MEQASIKQWRYWRGLSQRALAERAGVAQNTISRIEKEEMLPAPATLVKIARALDLDPRQIALDLTTRRPRGRPRKPRPTEETERPAA